MAWTDPPADGHAGGGDLPDRTAARHRGAAITLRDVSATEVLRQSEERYRSAFDLSR